MINITERLEINKSKLQEMQIKLQQLELSKQELLQEALRLEGENRLLLGMQRDIL